MLFYDHIDTRLYAGYNEWHLCMESEDLFGLGLLAAGLYLTLDDSESPSRRDGTHGETLERTRKPRKYKVGDEIDLSYTRGLERYCKGTVTRIEPQTPNSDPKLYLCGEGGWEAVVTVDGKGKAHITITKERLERYIGEDIDLEKVDALKWKGYGKGMIIRIIPATLRSEKKYILRGVSRWEAEMTVDSKGKEHVTLTKDHLWEEQKKGRSFLKKLFGR